MTNPPNLLQEQLALKRKQKAKAAEAVKAATERFDDDLIPDQPYQKTESDIAIDSVVDRIGILEAYERWCGKSKAKIVGGQVESIKLSCPNPNHKDERASYWINTDKNTGNCSVCGAGWDKYDIAGFALNFDVRPGRDGYQKDGTFPKLKRAMAEAYGWRIERSLGGQYYTVGPTAPETDSTDQSDNTDEPDKTDISDTVDPALDDTSQQTERAVSLVPETDESNVEELYDDGGQFEITLPTLEWRELVPTGENFISSYMAACIKDEAPEEYHFFNALLAVGFAAGRQVTLASKMPVYGNLFLCALGKSGAGKSTAGRHLRRLLKRALPYKADDPNSKGVLTVTPSSAEVLIKSFSKPITDPTDPNRIVYYAAVSGLIDFNEMSGLIGRTARTGNILKPVMMDFYDMVAEVKSQSLSSGTLVAENAFASCSTTTQPAALRDLIRNSDDASGFLNRWVFVAGVPKKSTIMGTGEVELDEPVHLLEEIIGWTASFKAGERVKWSLPALGAMQEFFDKYIYPLKNKTDTNIFVRMDLLMLKLVLLFSINKMEREVTVDTVETVKKMLPYLQACYGVPADQMGNTLEHEMTDAIVYQMKRLSRGDGASLNAIALALKKRKYPKEMILRNIKALIELGFVEEVISSAGKVGRPTKKYKYVA